MPANLEAAVEFIGRHGDELDQVRLNTLLKKGTSLSPEQEQRFLAGQRSDDGWPAFWSPGASSLDATCFRIAQGEGLAVGLEHPAYARAIAFLRARQGTDGSWEEDAALRDVAPPWARPGDQAARLYLTANCGWWLANATWQGFASQDEAAQRAGAYLERHVSGDGSLPSFLHAHWLAAGLWFCLERGALAFHVLDYLATRLNDSVPASSLAWLLTTLGGPGIAPDHPCGQKATMLLAAQQHADGGWASEDGPERDPYVTVEALRGLMLWSAL